MFKKSIFTLILAACMAAPTLAQDAKPSKVKVNKELKKVLKSLDYNQQLVVLDMAKRQADLAKQSVVVKEAVKAETKASVAEAKPVVVTSAPVAPSKPVAPASPAMSDPNAKVAPAPVPPTPAPAPAQTVMLNPNGQPSMSGTMNPSAPVVTPAPAEDNRPDYLKKAEALPKTTVEWVNGEKSYNFGKIKQGDVVKHSFTLKNTGANPLTITQVKPSCGCTAPKYPTEPIAPGQTGVIDIEFNSAGKMGAQTKSVTIWMNTEGYSDNIMFTGDIYADPATAPAEDHSGHGH